MKFVAPLVLVLCACQPLPTPTEGPDPTEGSCGAKDLQDLVGKSKDVLAAMTFPAPMRVIAPSSIVETDYRLNRLNIKLDRRGRIKSVYCG